MPYSVYIYVAEGPVIHFVSFHFMTTRHKTTHKTRKNNTESRHTRWIFSHHQSSPYNIKHHTSTINTAVCRYSRAMTQRQVTRHNSLSLYAQVLLHIFWRHPTFCWEKERGESQKSTQERDPTPNTPFDNRRAPCTPRPARQAPKDCKGCARAPSRSTRSPAPHSPSPSIPLPACPTLSH